MKVIAVSKRYYPYIGGVETHIKNIVERLSKYIDVGVYTLDNKDGYDEINGIPIHRFKPKISLGNIEVPSREFLNQLERCKADIIHIHNLHTLLPYYICKSLDSSKIIITPHYHGKGSTTISNILFQLYKTKLQSVLDKARKIICVTEDEYSLLSKDFTISSDKVVIIPNGVDTELLSLAKDVKRDPLKILFVGRFVKYKHPDKVIEAMRLLRDYKLTLVGNGEMKDSLVKLINKLNLDDRVRLRINIPREELAREYASSSIFILPSELEAQGISVMEALMFRLKVIVANTSALREYVKNGSAYGIDPPITAQKIVDSIRNIDSYRFKEFNVYSWDQIAEKVLRVYEV